MNEIRNNDSFVKNNDISFNPDKRIEVNTGYTLHENYDPDKRIKKYVGFSENQLDSNDIKVYNENTNETIFPDLNSRNQDIEIESEFKEALPRNGGNWTDKPGDSEWKPSPEEIPNNPLTNPEHKTWAEILEKYGIDSIPFKDGAPDFSEVSKGTVEIDDFTDDRPSNFSQADEKLAEQKGCTPEEVAQWRKDNKYTWHECKDCKTLQKVPTEIHGNVPHSGGISEYKSNHANN